MVPLKYSIGLKLKNNNINFKKLLIVAMKKEFIMNKMVTLLKVGEKYSSNSVLYNKGSEMKKC